MPPPKDPIKRAAWLQKNREAHIGKTVSQETRDKISASSKGQEKPHFKGKPLSEEHKRKVSEGMKGMEFSEEHKRNLSEAAKKREYTEEEKFRLSQLRVGVLHTDDTKEKMAKTRKGMIPTEYNRKKVVEAHLGKPLSDETKAKISATLTGRKHTEETKKIMASQRQGENHPRYGVILTKEERDHLRDINKGEKCYFYIDGRNSEKQKYCEKWTPDFRRRVRAYWGNICAICGCTTVENGNHNMSVHHVSYNKKACCKNDEDVGDRLFATTCKPCHTATNRKEEREAYIEWFTLMIELFHDGKCYYTFDEYVHLKMDKRLNNEL